MTLRPGWPTTLAAALTAAVSLQLWFTLETLFHLGGRAIPPLFFESLAIVHLAMALGLTVATGRADAAVDAGAPPLGAYGRAVLVGTAFGALAQYALHLVLRMPSAHDPIGGPPGVLAQPLRVFLEYLLWCTIGVYVYARLRSQRRAAARLQESLLEHQRLRRRTVEAQLQALQARVEPTLLRDTLLQVRARSDRDPAAARYLLDELASFLRAALPAVDAPAADVAAELAAVRSYAALRCAPFEHVGAGVEVHADSAALGAGLPPMLLMPLVEALLGGATPARLIIEARRRDATVEVALRHEPLAVATTAESDVAAAVADGAAAAVVDGAVAAVADAAAAAQDAALGAAVDAARARLRMLDGDAATIALATGGGAAVTIVLTLTALPLTAPSTADADRHPR